MKASGHTAVMADRAPELVEADSARTALYRRLEYFPTPPWAARAGGELIAKLDPTPGYCWEPCCGKGHMVHGLADYFTGVRRTDICNHGWDGQDRIQDFLAPERDGPTSADWIVTNPPFAKAAEVVTLGLQRARRGVAILARTTFFESAGRYPLFCGATPLTVFAPFFERVPMVLGRWDPKASTATAYAWFIWLTPAALADISRTTRRLFPAEPIVMPIAPGARDRLSRPEDARLFADLGAAPLLDHGHG